MLENDNRLLGVSVGDSLTIGQPVFLGNPSITDTFSKPTAGKVNVIKYPVAGNQPKLAVVVGCQTIVIDKDTRKKALRFKRMLIAKKNFPEANVNYNGSHLTEQDVDNFIKFLNDNKIK